MDDKSELLQQLRIERTPISTGRRRRWPWVAAALVLAAIAGAATLWLRGPAATTVQAVTARATASPQAASVLDASGYVVARRQATVSSKVTGKVVEVLIEEGKRVEAGQVLARIDDANIRAQYELTRSQVEATRAALAEIRVQIEEAERTLRRTQELAAQDLVSQAELDSAQSAVDTLKARLVSAQKNLTVSEKTMAVQQRQLDDTVVRAPFAGVITEKNAQPGEMISPLSAGGAGTRTGIGTLVDMDSLEIEVDVNESFINRVQPGQPVSAVLNAYPDWKIPCQVIAVIPTADRSKATVKVRIGFQGHDPRILPDMGVRVNFLSAPAEEGEAKPEPAVLVPAAAVLGSGDDGAVFIIRDDRVERRAVKLGGRSGDDIQVLSGLSGGERLAVGDLAALGDGSKVRVQP
jgi:RND family efflux transporter MFP subunit